MCSSRPWLAEFRRGLAWRAFLRAQARGVLACDLFAVEAVRLQLLHVLSFIELGPRRVFLAGCTEHSSAARVAQQARNVARCLADAGLLPSTPKRISPHLGSAAS